MSQPDGSRRTDEELLALAVEARDSPAGRRAASELLGRYGDQVYQWCFRYTRDHDGALDLAQDVLMRAYDKLGTFAGRSQFSSWLFMVTRRTCLNAIQRPSLATDPEFEIETLRDPAPGPDAHVMEAAEREEMLAMMAQILEPEEQEAMVLRYFEGMSPDEITRILGLVNQSGARALLQRARRKLTAALGTGSSS